MGADRLPDQVPDQAAQAVQEGSEPSDADLLAAHVAGDVDAFGVLFARHRDRLWAVALRTTGNPDDAADGLQDGLIAAYRRAGSFRGEAQVTTWLHRVVVNACLDRLRAARVRRAEPLPDDLEEYAARGAVATAAGGPGGSGNPVGAGGTGGTGPGDPEAASVESERRRRILAALADLPAEQRAALVLVDMEGYPVAEVAVMLDCAPGTVKSRCSRGRTRLAGVLGDLLHDGDLDADRDAAQRTDVAGNRAARGHVSSPDRPRGPPD